jgi:hypothetical protein
MNLIEANIRKGLMIKEIDQNCYHVALTRITVNLNDQSHPGTTEIIQVFNKEEYEYNENLRYAKNPIVWFRAAGYDTAIVVHDPTLLPPKEEKKESSDQVKIPEANTKSEERKKRTRAEVLAANRAASKNA